MAVRWVFFDGTTSETYAFDINPSAGGTPVMTKSIGYSNTSGPGGRTIVFEGRDSPKTMEFSGTILEQDQYQVFEDWYNKRHQILLTDDLGRQFWIYITEFTPARERARSRPWKHSYTMRATVLDIPT